MHKIPDPHFFACPQACKAGTKKENLPLRHEDTNDFYYKKFFFVSLCLCGHLFLFSAGKRQDIRIR
jgi:hypothetical protein